MAYQENKQSSLQSLFYFSAIILIAFHILIVGQDIIMSFVIALFIWYIINAVADGYKKIYHFHPFLLYLLSIFTLLVIIWFPIQLIIENIPKVMADAPLYQQNFERITKKITSSDSFENFIFLHQIYENINIGDFITEAMKGLARFTGNFFLISLYVVFLMIEQGSFQQKFLHLFENKTSQTKARRVLDDIYKKIKSYLWLKTILSIITATLSYVVMWYVSLDYAAVWALLIFFFNFIPNIGSVLATIFPALLTLVQFDTITPFLTVMLGVGIIQMFIGNVVEPKIMGNSLNLSSLVIILSLVIWGSIWGLVGAFLSVPLMVIMMIVLSEFKTTRPLAILLSKDGQISAGK